MIVTTTRLLLRPLDLDVLDAAARQDFEMIESLGYRVANEWPGQDMFEVLPYFRKLLVDNGMNGFNTWMIIEKAANEIIGSIGFLGNPDENGNVEIGFGIVPGKRRNGYCLEAALGLLKWASEHPDVRSIEAHCEEGNAASRSVLTRAGFEITGSHEGLISWEKKREE